MIVLALPPLRERRGDLQVLCEVILARLSPRRAVSLAPPVLAALAAYAFPGNVRELENVLERALAFADGGVIALDGLALPSTAGTMPLRAAPALPDLPERQLCLPGMAAHGVVPLPLDVYLRQAERDMIMQALVQARYHRARAARQLGLSVRQLRYRMQKLMIQEALLDERMDDR
ncbi:Nif-specific regulatory protein [compost metagenome]